MLSKASHFFQATFFQSSSHYLSTDTNSLLARVFKVKILSFIFLLFSILNSAFNLRFLSEKAESLFFITNLIALAIFFISFLIIFFVAIFDKKTSIIKSVAYLIIFSFCSILFFTYSDFQRSDQSPKILKNASWKMERGFSRLINKLR